MTAKELSKQHESKRKAYVEAEKKRIDQIAADRAKKRKELAEREKRVAEQLKVKPEKPRLKRKPSPKKIDVKKIQIDQENEASKNRESEAYQFLDSLPVSELKERAKKRGVTTSDKKRKELVIELFEVEQKL